MKSRIPRSRALSVVMSLVLVLGLMPLPAFAVQSEKSSMGGGADLTASSVEGGITTQAEAWDGETATAFLGSGTEEDPYIIATPANLAYLAQQINSSTTEHYVGKHFKQTDDLDLGNQTWTPIGAYASSNPKYFGGIYDGNNHKILNLKCAGTGSQALFGYVMGVSGTTTTDPTLAVVKNLVVKGAVSNTASTASYTGGVVAAAKNIELLNVGNEATITASFGNVGGVVGYVFGETGTNAGGISHISGCYNKGDITVEYKGSSNAANFGGITGYLSYSKQGTSGDKYETYLKNCYNTGSVTASGEATASSASTKRADAAGGIIGTLYNAATSAQVTKLTISNCYNSGSVSATKGYDGLIGKIQKNANTNKVDDVLVSAITNCYSTNGDALGGNMLVGTTVRGTDVLDSYLAVTSCSTQTATNLNTEIVNLLGSAFKAGATTPILTWENDATPPSNPTKNATLGATIDVAALKAGSTNGTITVTYDGDGVVSAASSNTAVVTVGAYDSTNHTFTVRPVGEGSADITVSATAGSEYKAADDVTISVTVAPADKTISVTVTANPSDGNYTLHDNTTNVDLTPGGSSVTAGNLMILFYGSSGRCVGELQMNSQVEAGK